MNGAHTQNKKGGSSMYSAIKPRHLELILIWELSGFYSLQKPPITVVSRHLNIHYEESQKEQWS